jgi:hypothetical protein
MKYRFKNSCSQYSGLDLVAIKPCLKSAPQELELDFTARQNLFAPTRPPWQLINQTVRQ